MHQVVEQERCSSIRSHRDGIALRRSSLPAQWVSLWNALHKVRFGIPPESERRQWMGWNTLAMK